MIGVVTAYGWKVGFELAGPAVDALILRSAGIVLGLVVMWRWIRRHQLTRQALAGGAVLLGVPPAAYILGGSAGSGADAVAAMAFGVLAVSALVVPVLSVALEPRLAGVALLGTWATAILASVLPTVLTHTGGPLAACAVATGVFTAVLARSLRPTTATGAPRARS